VLFFDGNVVTSAFEVIDAHVLTSINSRSDNPVIANTHVIPQKHPRNSPKTRVMPSQSRDR
jgi:hypothetical protein